MDREMHLCLVVPRDRVEEVRKKLSKEGLRDVDHRIDVEGDTAYLPVVTSIVDEQGTGDGQDMIDSPIIALGFPLEEHSCRIIESRPDSYKTALDIPDELVELLPSAYDVVGSIIVIRLPEELKPYYAKIGSALVDFLPSAKTALSDNGVEGEWRIRQLEYLAGEDTTRTIHKEYGVDMVVDLSKAYFSPRLANEHWRVASMVEEDEFVVDMFAGVGPFSLVISKHRSPKKILAVDINPGAVALLEESIELNKLDNITPIVEDARKAVEGLEADRIIMNLPHGARPFLKDAISALAEGGTVHYHEIVDTSMLHEVKKEIERIGAKIIGHREVRTYAPGQIHYAFDMKRV